MEKKLVERLQKAERRWPVARWIILANGVLAGGLSICVLVMSSSETALDSTEALGLLFFVLMLLYSIWCFCIVIRDWNGNPTRILLLKLLEADDNRNLDEKNVM